MPRSITWRVRYVAVMLFALLALAACGHSTEGFSPVNTAGPTHGVMVDVGASSYATTDAIAVTVRNQLSSAVIATDHQTSCTIVQLQIEVSGVWQNQGGCATGIATRRVTLAAGSATSVSLSPGAGQISAKPWPAGTYRIAFTYEPGETTAASETVVSASFTVA